MTSTGYTDFIDITGADAGNAPLVRGGLRAYYLTGSGGIAESAAQISAARAAGMGVVLIDQTPSLTSFAMGWAQVADVENYAGTPQAFEAAVVARQAKGLESVCYCSLSMLNVIKDALPASVDQSLVRWGVADYSWSLEAAQNQLAVNPDWVYCQYGDPATNPGTLVPGTTVTLAAANADIDVAKYDWAAQYIPGSPAPPTVPLWQENMMQALPELAEGATGDGVRTVQGLCCARGHTLTIDGVYGPLTKAAVQAVQTTGNISADGICGQQTWPVLVGVA